MEKKTIQDYCRIIDKLGKDEGVRSINIARALGIAKNTVALTLQKLSQEGYIEMERYGKANLTRKGRSLAKKMNFKHRVLETFLVNKLKISKNKVHSEACAMEHWISDGTIKRLYKFMGKPKTDPHGRVIL